MDELKPLNETAKYQNWHRHLKENQITLNSIDPIYIHRSDESLHFSYYERRMTWDDIKSLDGQTGKERMSIRICTSLRFRKPNSGLLTCVAFWRIYCT